MGGNSMAVAEILHAVNSDTQKEIAAACAPDEDDSAREKNTENEPQHGGEERK